MILRRLLMIGGFVIAGGAVGSQGQEFDTAQPGVNPFGVSEFRAGILVHSIDERGPNGELLNLTRLQDISFEVLFRSPDIDVFRWIGSPRPSMGVTLNLGGLESLAYLGLTWQLPIFDSDFFVEGTFGAAISTGALSGAVFPARNMGCTLNFYEAGGIGVNIDDNITAVLSLEHVSNAKLCSPNEGLTNLGIKIGYKF